MSYDPELEDFKRNIDLREYAAGQGYALSRKESWRGSAVMRNSQGDKIVIKRGSDGHYLYFSVRDDQDNGSIIDFVMQRRGLTLGRARQELRGWVGRPASSLPLLPALEPTTKDRLQVEQRYQKMQDAPAHPYLVQARGLSPALLGADRFAGRIRIDGYNNAIFPHFDAGGLCGYELKNRNFTGFATGGEKGLWLSRTTPEDHRLVIAESAIDALSYAALFPDAATRYASIGGKMNPRQPDLIKATMLRLPEGGEIVAAMDNDLDGALLVGMIETAVAESNRADLIYRPHFPALPAKDWNDVLRQRSQFHSFPAVRI